MADRISEPPHGFQVVEREFFIAAPISARILTGLGAEAVTIEVPDGDDPLRQPRAT